MIYLQLVALIILIIIASYINHHDYVAPGVIFASSFAFSTFWACMYAEEWGLGLHDNTFAVIVGGVLLFVVISGLVHRFSYFQRKRYIKSVYKKVPFQIHIDDWKLNLFIIFELFYVIGYLYYLIRIGASGSGLSDSIYFYRNERIKGEITERIPFYLRYSFYIIIAAGYWFNCVMVNNYFVNGSFNIKVIIIVVLSIVATLMEGGRNNAVNIMLSVIIYALIYNKRRNNFKDRLKPKTIMKICAATAIVLYGMVYFAKALGRRLLFTPMYYLAIYCGAEVKNLDIFLDSPIDTPSIIGEQTFVNIVKVVGGFFIPDFNSHYAINPYQRYNGYYLGNVYTTFKAYIYDFGFMGMIILVIMMAIVCQKVYEKALVAQCKTYPRVYLLIYGFLFNTIVLSFFSNKFYENLFSLKFVSCLIFWYLFYVFFCRFNIHKSTKTLQYILLPGNWIRTMKKFVDR